MLEIDEERRRISLGMKQCRANPWEEFSILFMSGYAGGDAGTEQELAAYGPLLDKPFALDGLARAVRDALDGTGVEGAGAGPSLT